jgi:putative tryptophan/tyrosine transport system ATP-binding protein
MASVLALHGITKTFLRHGDAPVRALDNVAMEAASGEFVTIVGHNGSGKSTLLNIVFGDVTPDAGGLTLHNSNGPIDLLRVLREDRASYIARVHQDPAKGTVADLTVWENLTLAVLPRGTASPFRFSSVKQAAVDFGAFLEPLGLADKLKSRASELSAGQRQLVAVLVALLRRPAILLLDEFTASLDRRNSLMCTEHAVRLARERGTLVLAVTHDLVQALQQGDRLLVMREGKVMKDLRGQAIQNLTLPGLVSLCGLEFTRTTSVGRA